MPAPPAKAEISDTYPNPSNAVARLGFAKFYDYVVGLLGTTGNATGVNGAHAALGTQSFVQSVLGTIFTALGFAYSFGLTNYIKFPSVLGGWIVQWGVTVLTTNSTAGFAITLPMTFPNAQRSYFFFNGDNAAGITNQTTYYGTTASSASTLAGVAINTTTGNGIALVAMRVNWLAFGN